MALPPNIQTYHCLCTNLLLASTHTLSSLPRRKPSSDEGGIERETCDSAIILPLPSSPPELSPPQDQTSDSEGDDDVVGKGKGKQPEVHKEKKKNVVEATVPAEGYTILLSLFPAPNTTIVRREDGFEKRVLYKCGRCRVVVGYAIVGAGNGDAMEIDGGNGKKEGGYDGKVIYILPGGVMGTDVMVNGGVGGKRVREGDVEVVGGGGVFE